MAVAGFLTAVAEFVGDRLVNACGQPAPGRVVRYFGHAIPDDYGCDDAGLLSVWWSGPLTQSGATPCSGPPHVEVVARWTKCWKLPEPNGTGQTLYYAEWDADAAVLVDVAECVAREFIALFCAKRPPTVEDDPFGYAVVSYQMGSNSGKFTSANPVGPLGGIAGVEWRIAMDVREPPEGS